MKLFGKVTGTKIIDMGKGKDAEAREVLVVTVKLDANSDGFRGHVEIPIDEKDAPQYRLRTIVAVKIDISQQALDLDSAVASRRPELEHAAS